MPKDKPSAYTKRVARIAHETVQVDRRLRKKYPQMYKADWGKSKKKKNWAQRLKAKVSGVLNPKTSVRTRATEKGLKKAGVTGKKIKRMKGY